MDFYLTKGKLLELQQMDQDAALEELTRLRDAHKEKRNAQNRERYHRDVEKTREQKRKRYAALNPKRRKALQKARWQREKANEERMVSVRERNARCRRERGLDKNRVRDIEQVRAKDRRAYQRKKSQKIARADPSAMRKLIRVHVPGYLMSAAQMDVINSVMVQILDRKVPFNDLAAWVKKAVTEYNRQFDHFKNVSIDAPFAGTDGLTRADLIDSEAFHF